MDASRAEVQPEYQLQQAPQGPDENPKLVLEVPMPGVQSSRDIVVVVREDNISVFVAGLYRLELALGTRVTQHPESLKFLKRRALLRIVLVLVDSGDGRHVPQTNGEPNGASIQGIDTAHGKRQPAYPTISVEAVANSAQAHNATSLVVPNIADGMEDAAYPSTADDSAAFLDERRKGSYAINARCSNNSKCNETMPQCARTTMRCSSYDGESPKQATDPDTLEDALNCQHAANPITDVIQPAMMQQAGVADGKSDSPASTTDLQHASQPDSSDATMYSVAQAHLNKEAAAAFAERAAALTNAPPNLTATKRAIVLLHKAIRLDSSHEDYQRRLHQAEQLADELRSQQHLPCPQRAPHSAPHVPRAAEPMQPSSPAAAAPHSFGTGGDDSSGSEAPKASDAEPDSASGEQSQPLPDGPHAWMAALGTLCYLLMFVVARFVARVAIRAAAAVLHMETVMALSATRLVASRRFLQQVQGAFVRQTRAAMVYYVAATCLLVCCAIVSPLLFTWPIYVAAFLWRQLLWAPYGLTSLAVAASLYLLAVKVEPVFQLVVGWPLLLWACRGGLWGLGGVASHVLLLGIFGYRAASTTATLCSHGLWLGIAWSFAMRWWLALPAAAINIFVAAVLMTMLPSPGGNFSEGLPVGQLKAEVPPGAVGEVARVLGATSHYEVLQVSPHADLATIQKAKRAKLLACHPDKVGASAAGAGHAVARITTALTVLSDPRLRVCYDAELHAATTAPESSKSNSPRSNGGSRATPDVSQYPVYTDDPGILLPTRGKEGALQCPRVQIDLAAARRCDACRCSHPAKDEDIWVNKSSGWFGARSMLYCQDRAIYDVTNWADKEKLWNRFPVNSHTPLSVGKRGGDTQQGTKPCRKKKGRRR